MVQQLIQSSDGDIMYWSFAPWSSKDSLTEEPLEYKSLMSLSLSLIMESPVCHVR